MYNDVLGPVMINELSSNFNNTHEMNYSIHIDPELRFIYFNNPKCACTTIKASLNLSYSRHSGKELSFGSIADIHERSHNYMLSPSQVTIPKFLEILEDPKVLKFCFVREPLARLASCYESMLRWPSPLRRKLAERTGHDAEWSPSFEEFIFAVAGSDALRDCDEHWRLQARQLCIDQVRYHFIGKFDEIERGLLDVLKQLFGDAAIIYDVRRHFRENTSASAKRLVNVDSAISSAVAEAYSADVKLYQQSTATISVVHG